MGSSKSPRKKKSDSVSKVTDSSEPHKEFIVVGIGASAGGITPIKDFFGVMPADSGMAFVVILHLSPENESHLHEIIQKTTEMPVIQVQEPRKVEPNHVYVIPPGRNLLLADGKIELAERETVRGVRVPVDLFMRTLAEAYGKNGVGVILSGLGADGSVGIKHIKEAGGVTIAQEPREAEYDGMPRSAIRTRMVDLVLPVAQMPERLLTYKRGTEIIRLPETENEVPAELSTGDLQAILAMVRIRTGHDFSNYKQPTMLRRVARRMQVNGVTDFQAYLEILSDEQSEAGELLRDLLISVTNFFRDKAAFDKLEAVVIPQIFADKTADEHVRVWCVGCATGEEAYTLAILLREQAERMTNPPKIQVFASDIDEAAIGVAREGRYDVTIEVDVSSERLRRFFDKEGDSYRVKKEIREMILFAPHNILRDSPFSRQDLIACRNVMIYLNRETQEKVLEIFHFALKDEGYLFLGTSDSADSVPALFSSIDKKQRLYKMRPSGTRFQGIPSMPLADSWRVKSRDSRHPATKQIASIEEMHHRLVEQFSPPSILVNENHDILHLSENATQYLRFTGGEPTRNLSKVAHPALRPDLLAALFAAKQENSVAESRHLPLEINGEKRFVNLTVHPVETPENARGFFLIIFDEIKADAIAPEILYSVIEGSTEAAMESVIRRLEEDLQRTKERLRQTIEQNEVSLEELKASNEELQAINEELRSATEELETSKEELQSVNEELTTVNHELKDKVEEVSRAHSDLQNLMASTDIGTIFLDKALQIKRFTAPVQKIFNVIASDVGRPIEHVTHRLDYENLIADAQSVMRSLQTIEREIRSEDDRWYIARFVPYRTEDDRIDGVLLSFMDFTERKRAEEKLRELDEGLRALIKNLPGGAAFILDRDLRYLLAEGEALAGAGLKPEDLVGKTVSEALPPELAADYEPMYRKALAGESFVHEHVGHNGVFITRGTPLRSENGEIYGALAVSFDISDRKKAEDSLRESEERLRLIMDSAEDYAIMTIDGEGRFTGWNTGAEQIFGFSEKEAVGQNTEIIFTPEDREKGEHIKELETARSKGRAADERFHIRKDGTRFYVSGVLMKLEGNNEKYAFAKIARDLSERQQMEETLKEADRRKDEFLATLAHELRNPLAPIRSGLQVIRRDDCTDDAMNQTLAIIERQTNQMVHLVDDLLDISRITQGKIKLKKSRFELKKAVDMALETSVDLLEVAGHKLNVSIPEEPIYLDADFTRITQIILNLLNNSVKYTEPGGKIWIKAERVDNEAVISIKDTGIGIPPKMLSQIFEMFRQIQNTSEQARGGLGIGLSVVKRLVEMHQGTITADSAGEGKGSEFTVRLPLAAEQSTKVAGKTPSVEDITQSAQLSTKGDVENAILKEKRILLVDDNQDAAQMLELLLTMDGHTVRTAYDGEKGIEIAKEYKPDVCLLDIGLPVMDGYEAARQLRKIVPDALMMSLSGWGAEEDRRRSLEAGFDYHLVKPVEIEDIYKLMTNDAE